MQRLVLLQRPRLPCRWFSTTHAILAPGFWKPGDEGVPPTPASGDGGVGPSPAAASPSDEDVLSIVDDSTAKQYTISAKALRASANRARARLTGGRVANRRRAGGAAGAKSSALAALGVLPGVSLTNAFADDADHDTSVHGFQSRDTKRFLLGSAEAQQALGLLVPVDEQPATVYSPLSGRVVKTTSSHVQTLASMGIAPIAGVMSVVDSKVLNDFAADIRGRRAAIPLEWPVGIRKRLAPILTNPDIHDPAEAIGQLLRSLESQRSFSARSQVGLIGDQTDVVDQDADVTPEEMLNEGQRLVLQLVRLGCNMYIGGTAGTGKTVLLRAIRRALRATNLSVGTTATTGLAAAHLGGVTFHSFFNVNLYGEFGATAGDTKSTSGAKKRSARAASAETIDVLIVDEISMMDRFMVEALDLHLRRIRNRPTKLFGGVQVIVCGDFLQLEPVSSHLRGPEGRPLRPQIAFTTPLFRERLVHVQLTQQVRQSSDPEFGQGLLSLRRGVWPASFSGTIKLLTHDEGVTSMIANANADLAELAAQLGGESPATSPQALRLEFDSPTNKRAPELASSHSDRTVPRKAIHLVARNKEATALNDARVAMLPGDPFRVTPCPQAPSVSGQWSSSLVMQVNLASFDAAAFRRKCKDFLRASIDALPVWTNGGTPGDGYLLPGEITALLETSSAFFVLYPFMKDGYVMRVRVPTASHVSQFARHRFRELWSGIVKEVPLMSEGHAAVVDVRDSADGLQTPDIEEALTKTLDAHPVAGQPLSLKVGMEVMLRVNLTSTLINGLVGVVTGFVPASTEKIHISMQRVPNIFTVMDAYVSQQRFIHGVELPLLPLVEFRGVTMPKGTTEGGNAIPIPPVAITAGGDVLTHFYEIASVCLPLVPAYAFTIHKVQGMTLGGDVHVALGRMWKCNHIVYVALSRVRRAAQLTLSGFKPKLVSVNPQCVAFDGTVPEAHSVTEADVKAEGFPIADWAVDRLRKAGESVAEVDVPLQPPLTPDDLRAMEMPLRMPTALTTKLLPVLASTERGPSKVAIATAAHTLAVNAIAADKPDDGAPVNWDEYCDPNDLLP